MWDSLIYMLAGAAMGVKSRWLVEAVVLPQGGAGCCPECAPSATA